VYTLIAMLTPELSERQVRELVENKQEK